MILCALYLAQFSSSLLKCKFNLRSPCHHALWIENKLLEYSWVLIFRWSLNWQHHNLYSWGLFSCYINSSCFYVLHPDLILFHVSLYSSKDLRINAFSSIYFFLLPRWEYPALSTSHKLLILIRESIFGSCLTWELLSILWLLPHKYMASHIHWNYDLRALERIGRVFQRLQEAYGNLMTKDEVHVRVFRLKHFLIIPSLWGDRVARRLLSSCVSYDSSILGSNNHEIRKAVWIHLWMNLSSRDCIFFLSCLILLLIWLQELFIVDLEKGLQVRWLLIYKSSLVNNCCHTFSLSLLGINNWKLAHILH